MPDRRKRWLQILIFVLGPAVLFGPMLFAGRALFWGTPLLQFAPWRELGMSQLRAGFLPLWNPLLGMGAPLLANYQSAFFYPPNWILLITGSAWGQTLLVALHLIWSALGMAYLTRRLEIGWFGQTVAGLAYGMSGYLVARAGFLSINAAAAWLPWILAASDRLATESAGGIHRQIIRAGAALAVFAALQLLSGHAQTTAYTLVLAVIWGSWRGFRLRGWAGLGRWLATVALAVSFALALAAIQLAPTGEYLLNSSRAGAVADQLAFTYSFWPWRLTGLLLPNLFGNPAYGEYWGFGNFWEDAVYVGLFPFVLALVALRRRFAGNTDSASLARLLTATAIGSLVLALGSNTPVFPFLYARVPGFDMFQAPTRWNLLLVASLSLLAGMGADVWRAPQARGVYWVRLGTAGAFAIGLAAVLAAWLLRNIESSFLPAFIWLSAGMLVIGAASLRRPESLTPVWQVGLALLVATDLTAAGWGLNPSIPIGLFEGRSALVGRAGTNHRLYLPEDPEYRLKFEELFRFDTFAPSIEWDHVREFGLPNVTILDNLSSANNFDPLLPVRYSRFIQMLEGLPPPRRISYHALMDVAWLGRIDSDSPLSVSYEPLPDAQRARFVGQVELAGSVEDSEARLLAIGFDPAVQAVIEADLPVEESDVLSSGEVLQVVDLGPDRVRVEVRTSSGGWLLLSDLYYPGWRAWVDGTPTTVYPADVMFRAIWVPSGAETIDFRYRPSAFYTGAGVSLLAWIFLLSLRWRWRSE